jgi:hypothetical protein
MQSRQFPILGTFTTLALALSAASFGQQLPPGEYGIKADPQTGSNIRRYAVKATGIPINRRYDELTQEQKAIINAWYERIDPGDEPPFPARGLKPILDAVRQAQQKLLVSGELLLYASIDPAGDVDSLQVFASPDPQMTKFVSQVLVLTKFKPALCAGSPCRMEYPFTFSFTLE